jgi:Mg-chelatase subunit ChlD
MPIDAKLYIPQTLGSFAAIAKANGGELVYASSDRDIASRIDELMARKRGASLDLVLCIDTTDTMINEVEALRAKLPALLAKRSRDFPSFRLGLVVFKDYFEEYLYKRFDFTRDLASFSANLEALHCGGGRDIPEAVYEALYAASTEFPWEAQARLVILVGDAPPHPLPRGSIGEPDVDEAAAQARIEIDAVAVPK